MGKQISGGEHALKEIFSSQFDFLIPYYQRPYAWEIDQAAELYEDLYDFFVKQADDNYFLGSIVLIKEEKNPRAEVIDGQQRLTTLTILLSAITSLLSGNDQKDFQEYIIEPGRASQGLLPKPRLTLRKKDSEFFQEYVQNLQFEKLEKLDPTSLNNDSQRNIQANSGMILKKLVANFEDDGSAMIKFGTFVMNQCFLVAVSTPNQQSAFRVFSVLNSRGLDLLPTDIVKADVLGALPEGKENHYTALWEDLEESLGRDGFNDLFGHIRMIFVKAKAKREMLQEFKEFVVEEVGNPETLMNEVIEPFAESYRIISTAAYQSTNNADEVNNNLQWLNRINNSDWIPTAIKYMSLYRDDSESLLWFTRKLERLTAYLHICGKYINHRISRYSELLTELEHLPSPRSFSCLDLSDAEKQEFRSVLDGDVYHLSSQRRGYLILRTDSFLSDSAATYNRSLLTLEHVLPQTVVAESGWELTWPDAEQRTIWVHRIANLAPLTQKRNSKASNYDFDRKKDAYFKGKNEVTSFIMTTQVIAEEAWTPAVVAARQKQLLELLCDRWGL